VLRKDKKADLKELQAQLGTSRLGFASEERLQKYLNLTKGAVTPLGVLNDETRTIEVIFDRDLDGQACLGVHPNDNTATVWLSFESLVKFVADHGNTFRFADFRA
jgi:Ala-tRNA(Pro) deacylase